MASLSSLSLFEVIKQKFEEKGRPLKLIVDWDEIIFPHKSRVYWEFTSKSVPFEDFFENVWKKVSIKCGYIGNTITNSNNEEIETFIKTNPEKAEKIHKEVRSGKNFYNNSPFLSPAEDLLSALKEDLIEEITLISSFRSNRHPSKTGDPQKRAKYAETFGKFPCSKINLLSVKRLNPDEAKNDEWKVGDNREIPLDEKLSNTKFEWIRNNPDFDIFIDDNYAIIKKSRQISPPTKIFCLTDLDSNKPYMVSNIVGIKVSVSPDLQVWDFAIGALEYRTKKLEQGIQELKTIKKVNPTPGWLIVFSIISGFFGILLLVIAWKWKPKSWFKRWI